MTHKKVTLHIGMHKTATTWLQKRYFPLLTTSSIIYNPKKLKEQLTNIIKLDYKKEDITEFRTYLETYNVAEGKELLLSSEAFSGDLFEGYSLAHFKRNLDLINNCFYDYEIKIVFVIREPVSWLLSCYKESIHEHHYQPLEDFLSISNNNSQTFANIDLDSYSPSAMIEMLVKDFDNVNILFFEDFRDNRNLFLNQLCTILQVGEPNILDNNISNKGYSPALIGELLLIMNCLSNSIFSFLVPKPIHFSREKSIYVLEKKKYSSFFGKVFKKLTFFIRRGRWVRYLARKRDMLLKDKGSFDDGTLKHINEKLSAEKTELVSLLNAIGIKGIPLVYKKCY